MIEQLVPLYETKEAPPLRLRPAKLESCAATVVDDEARDDFRGFEEAVDAFGILPGVPFS